MSSFMNQLRKSQSDKKHRNEMAREQSWLDIPYSDRAKAKRLGARWCPENKRWWIARGAYPYFMQEFRKIERVKVFRVATTLK
jgi:hypothetical protein